MRENNRRTIFSGFSQIPVGKLSSLHRQSVIFLLRLSRQQHPHRVDTDGGADRDIEEERNKGQNERPRPCPRFTVQQSPAGKKTQGGLCQDEYANRGQQCAQETDGDVLWHVGQLVQMREENASQKQQHDASERVERRIGEPQNGEQVDMTLNAARHLSDRRDWTDDLLATLTAESLSSLQRTAA